MHLRALLDATRDIRSTYHAASPSPTKANSMTLAQALSSSSPNRKDDRMTLAEALKSDMSPSKPRNPRPSPLSTPIRTNISAYDNPNPDMATAASPIVRTPTSAKLQPRSPFSIISPALRSLRSKAASARKEKKLSIGQLPRHEYPPDVPDRPLPLGSPRGITTSTTTTTTTANSYAAEDPFFIGAGSEESDADTIVAPYSNPNSPLKPSTTTTTTKSSTLPYRDDTLSRTSTTDVPPTPRRAQLPAFRFPADDAPPTTVDMAAVDPFERSWRRINARLLVAAFGREDCVLGRTEIEFIEDMAMLERR